MLRAEEMSYRLETERLTLRAFDLEDGPALLAAIDEGREPFERWLEWPTSCRTVRDAATYCRRARGLFDLGQDFRYAIFARAEGALVGGIAMHAPDARSGRCVLDFWVRPSFARRGIAAEALRAVTGASFAAGAVRVELLVEPNNRPSRSLAMNVGFRQEGVLRGMLVRAGRPRDVVIYGLLPDDWRRLAAPAKSHERLSPLQVVRAERDERIERDEPEPMSARA
jgi:RimJ/RimL family protein N-acetyltransferase